MAGKGLRYKWRRFRMGRAYRHMAELHPRFAIDPVRHAVTWNGRVVCELAPLSDLMGQHQGEPAFLVGSGPSLKHQDLRALGARHCFGMNGSIVRLAQDGVRPSYYVIADADFTRNRWTLMRQILASGAHCLFTPAVLNAICERDATVLAGARVSLYHNHFKDYGQPALEPQDIVGRFAGDARILTRDGRIGFSKDPLLGVFTAHTVMYFALQLAYGMGFRDLYLLGMDLGDQGGATRFYETGRGAMPSHMGRDYEAWILPSFRIVGGLCDRGELQVHNLSPISRLPADVVPRMTLEDALARLDGRPVMSAAASGLSS